MRVGVGGGQWRTCATRYDEPRLVWTSLTTTHVCVFITAVPITKLFARGGGGDGGHVLRETASRGLCELDTLVNAGERDSV